MVGGGPERPCARCRSRSMSRTGRPSSATTTPTSSELEAEQLWPRTWQMACRLEEIPSAARLRRPTRSSTSRSSWSAADDGEVRGLPERLPPPRRPPGRGRGHVRERVHLPVPRVVLRAPTAPTPSCPGSARSPTGQRRGPTTSTCVPVRCETWGGCAWINLDDDAPPLRDCIEPFATVMDAWKLETHAGRVVVRVSASR